MLSHLPKPYKMLSVCKNEWSIPTCSWFFNFPMLCCVFFFSVLFLCNFLSLQSGTLRLVMKLLYQLFYVYKHMCIVKVDFVVTLSHRQKTVCICCALLKLSWKFHESRCWLCHIHICPMALPSHKPGGTSVLGKPRSRGQTLLFSSRIGQWEDELTCGTHNVKKI